MPSDDLPQDLDLYAFLGVSTSATNSEITKAYRKKSLLYHPDKNPSESAAHIFHQLKLATDVLTDPSARAAYDNVRKAKAAKAERTAKYDNERRRMQADLEARERQAKRQKFDVGMAAHADEEEELVFRQELQRLKEESERLKRERDRKKQEELAQEEQIDRSNVTERTVKVRFRKGVDRSLLSTKIIERIFSQYGGIENVILGKSALVVFESVSGANAAISKILKNSDPAAQMIKEVTMAQRQPKEDAHNIDKTDVKDESNEEPFSTTAKTASTTPPKFSFKPNVAASNGVDYESITLMRMRKIEREKLEREIREQEAREEHVTVI